jgi:excisionase family DNA binding protein
LFVEGQPLWNVQQAAAHLGVRPSWLYERVRAKQIPHYRLGKKHLRFRQADLDAYLDEQRVDAR